MAVITDQPGTDATWNNLDAGTKAMFVAVYGEDNAAQAWTDQHAAEVAAQQQAYTPSAPQVPAFVSPGTNTGLPPGPTAPQAPPVVVTAPLPAGGDNAQNTAAPAAAAPAAAGSSQRTITPGLQLWAAQHGGSYNGWDALSPADRATWEGQAGVTGAQGGAPRAPVTGPPAGPTAPGGEPNAAMIDALARRMDQAAAGALALSKERQILYRPVFATDGSGNWTFEPITDATHPNGIPLVDPSTGQAKLTDAQIQESAARAAATIATNTGWFTDPTTGTRYQTPDALLKAQQIEASKTDQKKTEIDAAYQRSLATGTYVDPVTGQSTETLAAQKQAFDQQVEQANLWANPRNYLQASFLTNARGGLGGVAPNNQVTPTTTSTASAGFTAPAAPTAARSVGIMGEGPGGGINGQAAGAAGGTGFTSPPLGTPGASDHYATMSSPGGAQLHFFSSPTVDATVPVSAATRALLSGTPIPSFGAINGPQGGYVNQAELARAANPSQISPAGYANMTPSEQEQAKAVFSVAGYSDADTQNAIAKAAPQFKAPSFALMDSPNVQ